MSANKFDGPKMKLVIMRTIKKAVAANKESMNGGWRIKIDRVQSLKIGVVVN